MCVRKLPAPRISNGASLTGDLNAEAGVRKGEEAKGVGPFEIGDRNERGERLLK